MRRDGLDSIRFLALTSFMVLRHFLEILVCE